MSGMQHLTWLLALNRRLGDRMYAGTVTSQEVERRRAKGKQARASRRVNRKSR